MTRRIIIPDSFMRGKPHKEQLTAMAEDLLEHMRQSINDPKTFKLYAESYSILAKLLDSDLPTEKNHDGQTIDVSQYRSE